MIGYSVPVSFVGEAGGGIGYRDLPTSIGRDFSRCAMNGKSTARW